MRFVIKWFVVFATILILSCIVTMTYAAELRVLTNTILNGATIRTTDRPSASQTSSKGARKKVVSMHGRYQTIEENTDDRKRLIFNKDGTGVFQMVPSNGPMMEFSTTYKLSGKNLTVDINAAIPGHSTTIRYTGTVSADKSYLIITKTKDLKGGRVTTGKWKYSFLGD